MKTAIITGALICAMIACETPSGIQQSPDNKTNTSGTTGSANMTDKSTATESGAVPAAGKDSLGVVKDSLTK